jgi:hypothetical protein
MAMVVRLGSPPLPERPAAALRWLCSVREPGTSRDARSPVLQCRHQSGRGCECDRRVEKFFLVRTRLSGDAVCEMSAGRGLNVHRYR